MTNAMKQKLQKLLMILGVAICFVCVTNGITTYAASASKPNVGVSTTKESGLNIRSSASTSSKVLTTLNPKAPIQVVGTSGDFYKVVYNTSGKIGYAHKSYINISSTKYGKVTTSGGTMNFRASATTSSKKIGSIPNGTILPIISSSNGWHKEIGRAHV